MTADKNYSFAKEKKIQLRNVVAQMGVKRSKQTGKKKYFSLQFQTREYSESRLMESLWDKDKLKTSTEL